MPQPQPILFGRGQGSPNTEFIQEIETFGTSVTDIIIESSVTTPLTVVITVEVSADNGTNWILFDNINTQDLPNKMIGFRHYNDLVDQNSTLTPPTIRINPSIFPKIRVTVPALGSGISATVSWALN